MAGARPSPMPELEENISTPLTEAATNFFNQLPDISLTDDRSETHCDICLESFGSTEDPESPTQLPCGHILGRKCLSKWLGTSNSCPLCRRVLFEQNSTLTDAELPDLLGVIDRMEADGVDRAQAAVFVAELSEIMRQAAANERWFADFGAQDARSIAGGEAELRVFLAEVDRLHEKSDRARVRLRELMEASGIPVDWGTFLL